MRHLAGDPAKRLAALPVVAAFEAVEPGCAVQDNEVRSFRELGDVLDGLLLFREIEGFLDDDSGRDFVHVVGTRGSDLFEAVHGQPFGVDVHHGTAVPCGLDRGPQRDVRLPGGGRAIHLCHGSALQAAPEQVVHWRAPCRQFLGVGHMPGLALLTQKVPVFGETEVTLFHPSEGSVVTVVVATEDFEVYHDVVGELRDRGVRFTTVEPSGELPDGARIVIRGADDEVTTELPTVVADPNHPRKAVEEALAMLRGEKGRTVVGIDPGTRPGIAVLSGDMVVASFHVPIADAAEVVREEAKDAIDPVVRIGDGARLQGAQLIRELEDVRVELVDETGTTPYLGTGARGMGDVLAAVNIARLEGEIVEDRDIEPTAGELGVIKRRSRERSADNREIDEELARRVAAGELTIEEALAEHREE
jgi:hypothetical protein